MLYVVCYITGLGEETARVDTGENDVHSRSLQRQTTCCVQGTTKDQPTKTHQQVNTIKHFQNMISKRDPGITDHFIFSLIQLKFILTCLQSPPVNQRPPVSVFKWYLYIRFKVSLIQFTSSFISVVLCFFLDDI